MPLFPFFLSSLWVSFILGQYYFFFSCRERLRGSTTRFPHHKIPLLIFPFLYIIYFYPFAPFSLLIRSGGYETLHPERNYLAIPFLIAILLVAFLKSSSIFVLFFIVIIFFFSCITTYGKSSCWKDQQLLPLMHSCAMCMQLIHLMMNTESHAKWFHSYTTASVRTWARHCHLKIFSHPIRKFSRRFGLLAAEFKLFFFFFLILGAQREVLLATL